mmetsp:Transcript_26315/g.23269  ORF Transcript_26315/g.23269 Transcript_26315/m.23269 type:complete len:230 (-) Transcript_26315:551-1240(-)
MGADWDRSFSIDTEEAHCQYCSSKFPHPQKCGIYLKLTTTGIQNKIKVTSWIKDGNIYQSYSKVAEANLEGGPFSNKLIVKVNLEDTYFSILSIISLLMTNSLFVSNSKDESYYKNKHLCKYTFNIMHNITFTYFIYIYYIMLDHIIGFTHYVMISLYFNTFYLLFEFGIMTTSQNLMPHWNINNWKRILIFFAYVIGRSIFHLLYFIMFRYVVFFIYFQPLLYFLFIL